jgi:hypothetical protein
MLLCRCHPAWPFASLRDAYIGRAPSNTTLRLPACMVLIAPVGASHASGMVPLASAAAAEAQFPFPWEGVAEGRGRGHQQWPQGRCLHPKPYMFHKESQKNLAGGIR